VEPTAPCTVISGSVELSMDPLPTKSVLTQFANQVLSEVLVNPPPVLSVWPMCCPCPPRRMPYGAWLGGLLIKAYGPVREFDGEQRLHAGRQVERFTGPA
jgi:hypothetical protein